MQVRLYFDEDVDNTVALALRKQGHDILTTIEAKNKGFPDIMQLAFAVTQQRAFVTCNAKDFVPLHVSYVRMGLQHHGIIIAQHIPPGETMRRLAKLLSNRTMDEMANQLEYLSGWR